MQSSTFAWLGPSKSSATVCSFLNALSWASSVQKHCSLLLVGEPFPSTSSDLFLESPLTFCANLLPVNPATCPPTPYPFPDCFYPQHPLSSHMLNILPVNLILLWISLPQSWRNHRRFEDNSYAFVFCLHHCLTSLITMIFG